MVFERNNNEAVQHAENVGRILKLVFVRSVPYQRHDFSHGLLEGECPNHPINDAGRSKRRGEGSRKTGGWTCRRSQETRRQLASPEAFWRSSGVNFGSCVALYLNRF
jgi:hypothetical protein